MITGLTAKFKIDKLQHSVNSNPGLTAISILQKGILMQNPV
jgi:hypothetical protein